MVSKAWRSPARVARFDVEGGPVALDAGLGSGTGRESSAAATFGRIRVTHPVKMCVLTRMSQNDFLERSWLGLSLRSFPPPKLPRVELFVDNDGPNAVGLAEGYNRVLAGCDEQDILVMVHDDVYIHEWLLVDRLQEAMARFDVVGLAGSATPDLRHPSWLLRFDKALVPRGFQDNVGPSGAVGHSDYTRPIVSYYGETPQDCQLLDGLFMAVQVGKLRAAGVQFDPRFRFHCYDIDFCRSARQAGLRVGTWPIAVTHQSGGAFDSDGFRQAARQYLKKWREVSGGVEVA